MSDPNDLPLELDGIESNADRVKQRRPMRQGPEDDLSDVTFTKPGQSLLAKKSAYDRATNLRSTKASWRTMYEDFKGLGASGRLAVQAVLAVVGLVVLLWILRASYRGVAYAIATGRNLTRTVATSFDPQAQGLTKTPERLLENMRALWNEAQSGVQDVALPQLPQRTTTPQLVGNAWPSREQDLFPADAFRAPDDLVTELLKYKGIALTQDGLGVFHVDAPGKQGAPPAWIGGFGILKEKGASPKALLHGTLVHHKPDGSIFVATLKQDSMQQFWLRTGSTDKARVVSCKMTGKPGKFVPDGAGFILDPHRTTCLAVDYNAGELAGGQWCGKHKGDAGTLIYDPPTTIVSPSELRADGEDFDRYLSELEAILADVNTEYQSAADELRKFQKAMPKPR